jgi:hypothetical protein
MFTQTRPRSHRRHQLSRTRRWVISIVSVTLVASAALTAVLVPSPAADASGPNHGYGYVWAENPSTAIGVPYTPSPTYQFNSTGRVNMVMRTGVGAYSVVFPAFGPRGTALVTAYGGPSTRPDDRCKILRWSVVPNGPSAPDNTVLQVRCFTRTGAPVDSLFTASYTYPPPGAARSAYLLYGQPGGAVNPNFSYNSTGAANVVTRAGAGRYTVRLPGLALPPPPADIPQHVKVTAHGAGSAYCSVENVDDSAGADTVVQVHCFSSSGARVDSGFALSSVETGDILFTPEGSRPMAYATPECLPDPLGCVEGGRTVPSGAFISKVGPGQYALQVPLSMVGGNVQVGNWWTGRSAGRVTCKVAFWNTSSGVRINCYDRFGNPPTIPTVFAVSFVA